MGYAVVLGEALIDLLDGECDGEPVYRQAIGGAPLNVAVGAARLGAAVEFVGSFGDDALAGRLRAFLTGAGVGQRGTVTVRAPTTLGVATFTGAEPEFRFYGEPPSYGLLDPDALDADLVRGAEVLYCGSIALLQPPVRAAARRAWSLAAGLRVFDPNVRPRLLDGPDAVAGLRAVVAEFAARADLVKLSSADAEVLYDGATPERAAARIRDLGARTVVVTCGARGALVADDAGTTSVPAPQVRAVDATGAGDSVMAALIADLLADGTPDRGGWPDRVGYALRVAGLVCESRGGAVSMPTRAQVAARFDPS
jgi:fructokinase